MSKKLTLIFLVGISGSGKTSYAKKYIIDRFDPRDVMSASIHILERDRLRYHIQCQKFNDIKYSFNERPNWSKWNWKWEDEVNELTDKTLKDIATKDFIDTIIFSDTNLNYHKTTFRAHEIKNTYFHDRDVEIIYHILDVDVKKAISRDNHRERGVGESVIYRQQKQFINNVHLWYRHMNVEMKEKYKDYIEVFTAEPSNDRDKAIIVDIDGTIAKSTGRSWYDFSRVDEDEKIQPNFDLIKKMFSLHDIIMVTGRSEDSRDVTSKWLIDNGFLYRDLYMRPSKDNRTDELVKLELYNKYIKDKYEVVAVFDDRPKVCRMWRNIGLTTFQVGDPHNEF